MTVCIAALCRAGEAIVAASDRMVTAGSPMNLEFEHDRKKLDVLGGRFVVMSSGDALIGTTIDKGVEDFLFVSPLADISVAAESLKNSYITARMKAVEDQILRPVNYTLASFQNDGGKQLPPQIFAQAMGNMANFNLNAEFIIVGMAAGRGRIGYVHHPGALKWFDRLGFHAIGSGAIHASMSLIGHSISSALEQTLLKVYIAKKRAEVAPGVGCQTDVIIVTTNGVEEAKPELLVALERAYGGTKKQEALDLEEIRGVIDGK